MLDWPRYYVDELKRNMKSLRRAYTYARTHIHDDKPNSYQNAGRARRDDNTNLCVRWPNTHSLYSPYFLLGSIQLISIIPLIW